MAILKENFLQITYRLLFIDILNKIKCKNKKLQKKHLDYILWIFLNKIK